MILQSLKEYYDRKVLDAGSGISPDGFEEKVIPFIIVIDKSGYFVNIEFTGDQKVNKKGKAFVVPMWKQKSGKSSWKITNFLWDNFCYVLGVSKSDDLKDVEQAKKQNESFIKMIKSAMEVIPHNESIKAINNFYSMGEIQKALNHEKIKEITSILGCNLSFRINSEISIVPQEIEIMSVANAWDGTNFVMDVNRESTTKNICLITGLDSNIARLHRPISGVNKKPSPMLAVNNLESPSFASFNKKQGENFPVSEDAAFKYATALNYLLRKESTQKIQVGDATTIFWSEKKSSLESIFSLLFDEPPKDNPDTLTESVKSLYSSFSVGSQSIDDVDAKFFVLGLSPNAARISVRFWQVGLISEFSEKITNYFNDMNIVIVNDSKPYLPIKAYLKAIALLGDLDRVPPNLVGDWMRAILGGLPFPNSLYQMALRKSKIPTDEKKYPNKIGYVVEVQRPCMAVIKAYINRKKIINSTEKEMTVSLDKENRNIGYRLGRLFAALESIQEEALPTINATIRDKYYSACSGTPASVMPILMRMKNHHLGKLDKPKKIFYERILSEIIGDICDFPSLLNLQDQGRFAIGYYHQRQSFFIKNELSTTGIGE